MSRPELARLELLAEVDSLLAELQAWSESAPDWPPARQSQALMRRLTQRTDTLRMRLEAPLVLATLGGTGAGKSSLVNALVGAEATLPGRQRPTTTKPALICRPGLTAEELGIDPAKVTLVQRDLPALRDLIVIDCPDPDTTEEGGDPDSNLARLRDILPHCDVLLVVATQQKYRSSRVNDELAAAAKGARIVFVQTHADVDEDIREDWRRLLGQAYEVGEIFFIDSVGALADSQAGLQPRGEFARLLDFLTRELSGAAAKRIRRANFLDLAADALAACRKHVEGGLPGLSQLEAGFGEQRSRLAARLTSQLRDELLHNRRAWEHRLLGEAANRWGFSPFSWVLRTFHGLGGVLASAALWRVRSTAQLALWGAVEGGRQWRRRRIQKRADAATARAVAEGWDENELRSACIVVDGYAADAGLPRSQADFKVVQRQAADAGVRFVARAGAELQALLGRLADRHTGWFTRLRYELALCLVLGLLLYRMGRNFFFDSWLAADLGYRSAPAEVLGVDFFVQAGFWLLVWCGVLLAFFSAKLRRGLSAEIDGLAQSWLTAQVAAGLFEGYDVFMRTIRDFSQTLERLDRHVRQLRQQIAQPQPLGQRKA